MIHQAGVLFCMSALVPCPSGRLTKSITRTLRSFAGPASSVVFTRTGYTVKSMILQLCFLMSERVSFSYVIPTSKTGHPRFFRASGYFFAESGQWLLRRICSTSAQSPKPANRSHGGEGIQHPHSRLLQEALPTGDNDPGKCNKPA